MDMLERARYELELQGMFEPNEDGDEFDPSVAIAENVMELLQVVADQGHSGASADWLLFSI